MPSDATDRFRDRFQVQLGVNWQLMPESHQPWTKWLFDPCLNLVWFGKKLKNPRLELPEGSFGKAFVWNANEGQDAREPDWRSNVAWFGAALRVLGLDMGFGVYLRRKYDPT